MKKLLSVFVPFTAALILALPAGAAQSGTGKELCLLSGQSCPGATDSITTRIDRLEAEIDRGNAVYTHRELLILKDHLRDYRHRVESLLHPGGN